VRPLDNFDIDVFRLPLGKSQQVFTIDEKLFSLFPYSPVSKGKLTAKVEIEKAETLIVVKPEISGTIELICDRTDRFYDQEIAIKERVVFQFGTKEIEHTEHLFEIPSGTALISLSELFYNLIVVEIPMKKLHPDVRDQALEQDSEGNVLVYKTPITEEEEEDVKSNPFSQLLKLKNLN
jgi:uncharacterized metal-binding protein YceD (DUF177 family)